MAETHPIRLRGTSLRDGPVRHAESDSSNPTRSDPTDSDRRDERHTGTRQVLAHGCYMSFSRAPDAIHCVTSPDVVAAAYRALQNVWDPELGLDVVTMGLIYDVRVDESGLVVDMTLTTPDRTSTANPRLAQWHAERRASRPKVAKLAANDRLREYVQDRLAGTIARPDRELVAGPEVRFIGRRHGRCQDRRWAKAWSQISNRLEVLNPLCEVSDQRL